MKFAPLVAASAGLLFFGLAQIAVAQTEPQVIQDSQMQARTTTIGGASVLPTTRTVQHWFGTTLNPHDGITYGYNMVGADPNNCTGSTCSASVTADIIPLNVVVEGRTFSGEDVLPATLASPMFALNDYGSTPFATAAGAFPNTPALIRGPGGTLSQGDAGLELQLEDATMRAQFNKTGSSTYHLMLSPVIHNAITIVVPAGKGALLQSGRGVVFADVNNQWWGTRIHNLINSLGYVDPTRLPIFLTSDVVNFEGTNPLNCCVIGFHGTVTGAANGQGNGPVQTFAWASTSRLGSMLGQPEAPTGHCRIFTRSATRLPNGLTILSSTTPWSRGSHQPLRNTGAAAYSKPVTQSLR